MSSRTAARHRRRAHTRTPLALIGEAVSTSGSSVGRRSAVIAASGGLIVTMGLPAVASPLLGADTADAAASSSQPAEQAAPPVSAPAQAQVSFALTSLTTVDAAQYEHDAQVAAGERAAMAERASRASARYEAARLAATTTRVVRADDADDAATADASPAATPAPPAPSAPTATPAASSAPSSAAPAPATGASSAAVIDIAKRYTGVRYRFGGTTPAGFDCSGFVRYVYAQVGVDLPRTAGQQASAGARVPASEAKPGDIISFTGKGGVYHNGIYLGNGKMIDAPRSGKTVDVHDVWSSSVIFTRVV